MRDSEGITSRHAATPSCAPVGIEVSLQDMPAKDDEKVAPTAAAAAAYSLCALDASAAGAGVAAAPLTTRGILRGVAASLFFAAVVAVGFGVVGYVQSMTLGQRPVNLVDKEKCSCDCFDGA